MSQEKGRRELGKRGIVSREKAVGVGKKGKRELGKKRRRVSGTKNTECSDIRLIIVCVPGFPCVTSSYLSQRVKGGLNICLCRAFFPSVMSFYSSLGEKGGCNVCLHLASVCQLPCLYLL